MACHPHGRKGHTPLRRFAPADHPKVREDWCVGKAAALPYTRNAGSPGRPAEGGTGVDLATRGSRQYAPLGQNRIEPSLRGSVTAPTGRGLLASPAQSLSNLSSSWLDSARDRCPRGIWPRFGIGPHAVGKMTSRIGCQ